MDYNNLDYDQLLNYCFEIEGLLSLMQRREAECPEEVSELLVDKVTTLSRLLGIEAPTPEQTCAAPCQGEIAAEPSPAPEQPLTLDRKLAREGSRDLRAAFSLNDKFRFRRELFGNSDAALVDAINVIQAMHTYPEAEDYLYTELGWDHDSDDVKDFMAIIADHFAN